MITPNARVKYPQGPSDWSPGEKKAKASNGIMPKKKHPTASATIRPFALLSPTFLMGSKDLTPETRNKSENSST